MRGRENVGSDLLHAYEIVLEAPLEEQRELYETWQENTSQTLSLVLSPEECEAWDSFSSRDIDWDSQAKVALELRSTQAFLRALISLSAVRDRGRRRGWREAGPLDRFTRRARQVMERAQAAAKRLNHNTINSAHLLIGLTKVENSDSSRILGELGVTADQVEEIAAEMVGQDVESRASKRGETLVPVIKRTLEAAVSEARNRGHHYIDSAHLLLGLLQREDDAALAILRELGVSPEAVREATIEELDRT